MHATWCPHCHPTTVEPVRDAAGRLGLSFHDYDIDKPDQEKAADDLVRRTGRVGVPVIEIDGRPVIGFDQAQIDRLLGLRRA